MSVLIGVTNFLKCMKNFNNMLCKHITFVPKSNVIILFRSDIRNYFYISQIQYTPRVSYPQSKSMHVSILHTRNGQFVARLEKQ